MVGTIFIPLATPCPRGCLRCMRATLRWEVKKLSIWTSEFIIINLWFHRESRILEVVQVCTNESLYYLLISWLNLMNAYIMCLGTLPTGRKLLQATLQLTSKVGDFLAIMGNCVCVCALLLCQVWIFVTPCPSGSSVHGISQGRLLEWVAISFSSGKFL